MTNTPEATAAPPRSTGACAASFEGAIEKLAAVTDIERALTEWIERPKMTKKELMVLATHEAGHAVCSLFCEHAPPIERITIESDNPWAFGYVSHQDPAHRYIQTRNFYLDAICVALGARESESLLLDDLSMGAVGDIQTATAIARDLVEVHGMGGPNIGMVRYRDDEEAVRRSDLSETQKQALDQRISELLEEGRQRAAKIVQDNRAIVELIRDELLEKKTIESRTLSEVLKAKHPNVPSKLDKSEKEGTEVSSE